MPRRVLPLSAALVFGLWLAGDVVARERTSELTAADRVAAIYDLILDANTDDAAVALTACEQIPTEACLVLDATRLWWIIQLDPVATTHDAALLQAVEAAVAAATAWTEREPTRAEAWFYLGGAYGVRVQWRVLRGERLAAARDGKRVKDALDRAVSLDPDLDDAYFGLGLYQYDADVAPRAARFFRWLLLLPGGDRAIGLARMERARDHGRIFRGEALYQLHVVNLWYENAADTALEQLRDLTERYPRNPLFPLLIGDLLRVYKHDVSASRDAYAHVLQLAEDERVHSRGLADARARLSLADRLDELDETDAAIDVLRPLAQRPPAAPYGAHAEALQRLGRFHDRLGQGTQAAASYQAARAAVPADDRSGLASRIQQTQSERTPPAHADAYRLSLDGWRALERGDVAHAAPALARALSQWPDNAVIRYRYARALETAGDAQSALAEYERVISSGAPPVFLACAYVQTAALLEEADRTRALALYRRAAHLFGAAADTKAAAAAAVARLSPSANQR